MGKKILVISFLTETVLTAAAQSAARKPVGIEYCIYGIVAIWQIHYLCREI
jgi:hypothetical protein